MTKEKRKEAIAKLNQEIQSNFKELQQLLLLESDAMFANGGYIPQAVAPYIKLDKVLADKAKLMTTISDLTSVCRALERGKDHVTIHSDQNGHLLLSTIISLDRSGLIHDDDELSNVIWFY